MLGVGSSMNLFAQSETIEIDNGFDLGCSSTYWGTEASTHPNNPCKGATTRKCAEITTQILPNGNGSKTVIQTVRDGKGKVLGVSRQNIYASIEDIIQQEISTLPANAIVTEVKD